MVLQLECLDVYGLNDCDERVNGPLNAKMAFVDKGFCCLLVVLSNPLSMSCMGDDESFNRRPWNKVIKTASEVLLLLMLIYFICLLKGNYSCILLLGFLGDWCPFLCLKVAKQSFVWRIELLIGGNRDLAAGVVTRHFHVNRIATVVIAEITSFYPE